MNVVSNTTNMDVAGVSQTPVVERPPEVQSSVKPVETTSKPVNDSGVTKQDVEDMVDALKDLTETLQTKLNFSVDEGTNDIVVKVIDKETDKVIKQIPPESMLELQEKMQDLTGFLLSDNV